MAKANDRQQQIIEMLRRHESLRVSDLAEACQVSRVTLRKDIAELEGLGLATKLHGRISLSNAMSIPYILRAKINTEAKMAIARAAAAMIEPDDSIILDAGSTTTCIAKELLKKPPASIITNCVPIAFELCKTDHYVSVCGGELMNRTMSLAGPDADKYFAQVRTKKAFIATTGIRENFCLATSIRSECGVKEAMIKAAETVILCADSSKFFSGSMFQFATGEQIDIVITTRPEPPKSIMDIIRKNHIELIFADEV